MSTLRWPYPAHIRRLHDDAGLLEIKADQLAGAIRDYQPAAFPMVHASEWPSETDLRVASVRIEEAISHLHRAMLTCRHYADELQRQREAETAEAERLHGEPAPLLQAAE